MLLDPAAQAEAPTALNPRDEADLAEAVAAARTPLNIRGGGTRPIGGARSGVPLSVSRLSGVTHYDPAALTLVAAAGTPLDEIETLLAAEGQRLPFEPMDHRPLLATQGRTTIGGVVAANVAGPRRIQAGACRDSLIGLRFVDGSGMVVANGGRVMKNVTGYDLVRLLAGSHGTLGVLTEVAFKVLPRPEAAVGLSLEGLADRAAVAALSVALGSPFEVTGAAHLPRDAGGRPLTLLRLESFEAAVAYRAEALAARLADFGAAEIERDPSRLAKQWRAVRDVSPFAGRPGAVWRVSVRPSDGPGIAAAVPEAEAIYDWGGGLVWLLLDAETDLRQRLGPIRGHATLVRRAPATPEHIPTFQPEPPAVAALSAGLRRRFDPKCILNPGLMEAA